MCRPEESEELGRRQSLHVGREHGHIWIFARNFDDQFNEVSVRQSREVCTSLIDCETVSTNFKSRPWLESGVGVWDRQELELGLVLARRSRLALAAVPLHILHQDDLIVNWRIVAFLMPCIVASIAEHDGVVGRAVAPIAMDANDIGILLARATLALLSWNGGWRGGKGLGCLDDSASPAGPSVQRTHLRCRQPSGEFVSRGFLLAHWGSQLGTGNVGGDRRFSLSVSWELRNDLIEEERRRRRNSGNEDTFMFEQCQEAQLPRMAASIFFPH